MIKDFLGKELNIGDKVVSLTHSRTSSWFNRAVVIGFTPKMVRVRRVRFGDWVELKAPDKIVKVEWSEND